MLAGEVYKVVRKPCRDKQWRLKWFSGVGMSIRGSRETLMIMLIDNLPLDWTMPTDQDDPQCLLHIDRLRYEHESGDNGGFLCLAGSSSPWKLSRYLVSK